MNNYRKNIIGLIGVFTTIAMTAIDVTRLLRLGPNVIHQLWSPFAIMVNRAFFATHRLFANHRYTDPQSNEYWASLDIVLYWVYLAAFIVCMLSFAILYWRRTNQVFGRTNFKLNILLIIQLLIALAANPNFLVIIAAELALVLPQKKAVLWLIAVLLLSVATSMPYLVGSDYFYLYPALDFDAALFSIIEMEIWLIVAFGVGYLAAAERRNRLKLDVTHAELMATQKLLLDTMRVSERVTITRNLHDAIGHHLTALNLHLDLGLRQSGDDAIKSFQLSRQLAQDLLSEVRQVISTENEERRICLRDALEILCAGIPYPRIALKFDGTWEIKDPTLAHVIFRSVQEAITNVIRHSAASIVNIGISKDLAGITISIDDDGRGTAALKEGKGLSGMRGRIEELRGKLDIVTSPLGGLRINIWLPERKEIL